LQLAIEFEQKPIGVSLETLHVLETLGRVQNWRTGRATIRWAMGAEIGAEVVDEACFEGLQHSAKLLGDRSLQTILKRTDKGCDRSLLIALLLNKRVLILSLGLQVLNFLGEPIALLAQAVEILA
jgi:hypothetical protein